MSSVINPAGHEMLGKTMSVRHRLWTFASRFKDNEDGQILVQFALFIIALIGLAGLVIDLGIIFVERQELQTIADSAALAGAMNVDTLILAWGTNCFILNPLTPRWAARDYCRAHGVDDADCEISVIVDPSCGRTGFAVDSVTVTVKRDIDRFFFIHLLTGGNPIELKATATAKMVDDF